MKKNGATDVVKKWFKYLKNTKSKPNISANPTQTQDSLPDVLHATEEENEEFYDMEELLEHRIITEEEVEVNIKVQKEFSLVAKFHVENMSVLQSICMGNEFQKAIEERKRKD